jgi:hypothetical protein
VLTWKTNVIADDRAWLINIDAATVNRRVLARIQTGQEIGSRSFGIVRGTGLADRLMERRLTRNEIISVRVKGGGHDRNTDRSSKSTFV